MIIPTGKAGASDAAALLVQAWGTDLAGLPEQRWAMAAVRVPTDAEGEDAARLLATTADEVERYLAGLECGLADLALLAGLPDGCDPCGEDGEFHTLVSDGPMFRQPLRLEAGETVLRDERFAFTDFRLAG